MKTKLFSFFVKTIHNKTLDNKTIHDRMTPDKNASLLEQKETRYGAKGLFIAAMMILPLVGCSQPSVRSDSAPSDSAPSVASDQETVSQNSAAKQGFGTLEVKGNGEDFVRQGFVDKDGWQISFDHVYVTLADIVATQRDASIESGASDVEKSDTDKSQDSDSVQQVKAADDAITVDLASGDENAAPVMITSVENAPSGRYNALSWRMVAPTSGESAGYPLMMVGSATKAGETIPFKIQLTEELVFDCGDFIGEERKGILTAGETAEVEATFHFDHIFGDGDAAANDEINTGALGFGVLAALVEETGAENGELNVTSKDLEARLTPENYNNLKTVLTSLGHVGEGHCEATLRDTAPI